MTQSAHQQPRFQKFSKNFELFTDIIKILENNDIEEKEQMKIERTASNNLFKSLKTMNYEGYKKN